MVHPMSSGRVRLDGPSHYLRRGTRHCPQMELPIGLLKTSRAKEPGRLWTKAAAATAHPKSPTQPYQPPIQTYECGFDGGNCCQDIVAEAPLGPGTSFAERGEAPSFPPSGQQVSEEPGPYPSCNGYERGAQHIKRWMGTPSPPAGTADVVRPGHSREHWCRAAPDHSGQRPVCSAIGRLGGLLSFSNHRRMGRGQRLRVAPTAIKL